MTKTAVQPVPQNLDSTPHVTFYDEYNKLSFVWDGTSNHIQVCKGGYGEPVVDTIPINAEFKSIPLRNALKIFALICDAYSNTRGD